MFPFFFRKVLVLENVINNIITHKNDEISVY